MNTEINLDIEENSPFQEGVLSELIQRPDKSFFPKSQKTQGCHRHKQLST